MTDESTSTGRVAERASELTGETPLVHLREFAENLYGKLEFYNPMSSVKDRIAVNMLETAIESGDIGPETTIIEATSGNTGIGLAFAAAAMDREVLLCMPDSMSDERRQILRGLGARLELTPADDGMSGAIERAERLAGEHENVFVPKQFENPANPAAHREATGPEIDAALESVDVIVATVGTGGTLTGIAQYFKEIQGRGDVTIVAVEPANSAVLSGEEPTSHDIPGIGAGFVSDILEVELIDVIETVEDEPALETTRELAREAGVFAGISSGAAVHTATRVAKRPENADDTVVTILPDTGERYLSTGVFASE